MKEKQIEKTKKNMADFFAKIKNLSKKNKIVLLCIAVFIVLVSAGGITAAVLLARANVPPRPSGEFFTADYYQAIRPNDPTGIKLNDTWMRGYDFQYFRYESDNENLFVSDRMVLTSGPFVEWTDCKIKFYYKETVIATYYISIVPDAVYINNLSGLKAIPDGTTGTYIQQYDININGALSIKNFKGTYYGNYYTLSGADVSASGGIFDRIDTAFLYSINMKSVTGAIAASDGGRYGALVNSAYSSDIVSCYGEGSFTVVSNEGTVYAGGMFGYLEDANRVLEDDVSNKVSSCINAISLTVNASGAVYAGGIAGYNRNVTLANVTNRGTITVDAPALSELYAGGVAGYMLKYYPEFSYKIRRFDICYGLNNEGNVTVTTEEITVLNSVSAGGVFGYVKNVNVKAARSTAPVDVTTSGASVYAGGAFGRALNPFFDAAFDMKFSLSDVTGTVNVNCPGNVYAGGLTGYAEGIEYVDTVSAGTPDVTGTAAGRTVKTGKLSGNDAA